jgi:hypothetical protein
MVPFVVPLACPLCARLPEAYVAFAGPRVGCADIRTDRPILTLGHGLALAPTEGLALPGLEHFAGRAEGWLAPAEPTEQLPREGLRYAALDDGAVVTRTLAHTANGIVVVDGGLGGCEPWCEPVRVGVMVGPTAREAHAAVLSATREAVWILGGHDRATGAVRRDVWEYDQRSAAWRELRRGRPAFDRVLAATYSAADDAVLVLDETVEGRSTRVRLMRIDPVAEDVTEVVSWPRRSRNTSYALSVDTANGLWVVASPAEGRAHVVARFVVRANAVDPEGWVGGSGRLAGPPRAGDRGLTVVLASDVRRGAALFGYEASDLRDPSGAERACF